MRRKNKYRIVKDKYNGYEVQTKKWWFPFVWLECWGDGITNTHSSIQGAEKFIETHKGKGDIVKVYD